MIGTLSVGYYVSRSTRRRLMNTVSLGIRISHFERGDMNFIQVLLGGFDGDRAELIKFMKEARAKAHAGIAYKPEDNE